MPLWAFDMWEDGTARPASGPAPTGPGRYRWLHFDLSDPELQAFADAHLPEHAATAILQPETRPRVDPYADGLIVNLRGVNLNADGPVDLMVSLRMWATRGLIVTARKRRIFALEDIRAACEAGRGPESEGAFLADLVRGLAERARDVTLDLEARTAALEDAVDEDDEVHARALKPLRRTVLRLRRYLEPQSEALCRLLDLDTPVLDPVDHPDLREGVNLVTLADEALESLSARLYALADHIDAQTALRMTRNSYVLSIVAAVFLPLGFLTGLFGVNLAGMPGTAHPAAFAVLALATVGVGAITLLVLRWLRLF
jgi:zinc transporter